MEGLKIKTLIDFFVLICLILLLNPQMASAYLDPSAGNALIYIAVTLAGVAAYAAKGLFYRLTGKNSDKKAKNEDANNAIAIFSEGKNYWSTFEPIVNALIAKNQPFSYYTMDVEDPALKIHNSLMKNFYIGDGSAAFARLNRIPCKIMLATTPNIGTPGYPMPRPAKTEFLVHVFHDPDGTIPYYKKGSLDFYDAVLTVGDYAQPAIRYLENKRNLKQKELISIGVPYWDNIIKSLNQHENIKSQNSKKVILLAPSWGEKSFIAFYGYEFIKSLAKEFDIIFRPHPQSWKVEADLLNKIKNELADFKNISWDTDRDLTVSFDASDILISDTSAIRMDYAVLYKKPVITLDIRSGDISSFEKADLPDEYVDLWDKKLFIPVDVKEIGKINEIVRDALAKPEAARLAEIEEFVNKNIPNFGCAGEHAADYLIAKANALSENTEQKGAA